MGGNGKYWVIIVLIVIAMAVVVVLGMNQGEKEGTSASSTAPGTASSIPGLPPPPGASTTPVSTKAPKDYLPAAVQGFDVAGRDDNYKVSQAGEEAAATVFFKPSANSQYAAKVKTLSVYAHQFKDDASAAKFASQILSGSTVVDVDVGGVKAKLTYKLATGQSIILAQPGRMVIYCFAEQAAGATMADVAVLESAVRAGFAAIKF